MNYNLIGWTFFPDTTEQISKCSCMHNRQLLINIFRWCRQLVKSVQLHNLEERKTSPELWQILCWYKCSVSTINQAVPLCPEANRTGIKPRRGTERRARFKTHTQENRPRPAVVNHMRTKDLWRIQKGNVWLITNKHINNYGIFGSSYYAQGIVLVNLMIIINLLYHVITVRKLSLFWTTIKELPCCNYCYCVTSLSGTCIYILNMTWNQYGFSIWLKLHFMFVYAS